MTWKYTQTVKKLPAINNPILIEGLPGIGNVGKVVADFIVDSTKATKIYDIFSYSLPHTVFVNEQNLIELPKIEIYYKKIGKQDFLFLLGDIQPVDEQSCYSFCDSILDLVAKYKGKEIITIGGIGLNKIPKVPKIYLTGTSKKELDRCCREFDMHKDLFGVVGPIIGVSGVMAGLAGKRGMSGIVILAETFGHPLYLGVNGAKEILKRLDKKFKMKLNLKKLDKEITSLEEEMMKRTVELDTLTKGAQVKKIKGKHEKELAYIG
jgi:uncharacterized protein (TIGR00162 family)